jgi:hypothetical protein
MARALKRRVDSYHRCIDYLPLGGAGSKDSFERLAYRLIPCPV